MKRTANYAQIYDLSPEEASYLLSAAAITTDMYREEDDSIAILYKDGTIKDISEASDMLNIQLLSKKIKKYYFSYFR
jgi:hypothetical protein